MKHKEARLLVSIIIPTFNREDMIGDAVESVLSQDFFQSKIRRDNWELLVIDDGSDDKTKNVIQNFGDQVGYFYQDHTGVSAARNTGLRLCRGEYVAFLDSDDIWKKEKLRIQMGFMRSFPEAVMCYTDEIWIRNGRRVNPKKKHQKFSGRIFEKVLPLCLLSLSSALFKKTIFDEIGVFDEDLPACEDYGLGIRLAHRYDLHFIPRPLIIKRGGHKDQLSHAVPCLDKYRVRALEKALSLDLDPEQSRLVREEILIKSRILAQGFEKRDNLAEARIYLGLIKKYSHLKPEVT